MQIRSITAVVVFVCTVILLCPADGISEKARKHLKKGVTLYDKGKYEEAVAEYKKLISLEPNYYSGHYELGQTYWKLKQYDTAEEELNAALRLNPQCAICYMGLGNVADDRGDRSRAIGYYKSAIGIEPNNAHLRYNLAVTYLRTDNTKGAITELLEAESLSPNYASPFFLLGNVYLKLEKFYLASDQFHNALQLEKSGPRAEEAQRLSAFNIVLDDTLDKAKITDHMAYCLVRAGSMAPDAYRKRVPEAESYGASIKDETEVWTSWAQIMNETDGKEERPIELTNIVKVLKAGYIAPYLLTLSPDRFKSDLPEFEKDNPGKMDAFRKWASENHVEIKDPKPRCEVRWMDRTW